MTLNISGNNYAKAGLIAAFIVLVAGVWTWLSGGILMLGLGQKFEDATLLTMYQYWYYYGEDQQVEKWLVIAGGIPLAILLIPVILFSVFSSQKKKSLFGNARFATKNEIRKAGLYNDTGIFIGRAFGSFLMFVGERHVSLSAPTRGGKGASFAIPNLLTWKESLVVLDIKEENWRITSAYRHKYGQECYFFNPTATDYRTHRYNPLSYISTDPNFRIDDIQKIANMLFPDQPGTDMIWTATPRSLFIGIVLYLLETPGKLVTLGQVLRETLVDGDGSHHFETILNERIAAGNPLSPACARGLLSYCSIAAENTRSGIIGGFRSRLELWMNPLVDAATSGNDFDLRDVRKRRMSIYIGVSPGNLDRMAPLINLFFQQFIDLNTRELPSKNKALKHTCLLLMDEFTSIGEIPVLSKGVAYIAGYGLRMAIIIQSPSQLDSEYGKDAAQTFKSNHAMHIVYPPKATETQVAKDISEWLGYQTVKGVSSSKTKSFFGKKTPTENVSDQQRALLLPQEITGLKEGQQLVVVENLPPIMAQKVMYFKEPLFMNRLKEISPTLKRVGAKLPTRAQLNSAIEADELSAPVPTVDVVTHSRMVAGDTPLIVIASTRTAGRTIVVERPVTSADIPDLTKRSLKDFAVDFSSVGKPRPGDLNEAALHAYADSLCGQVGVVA